MAQPSLPRYIPKGGLDIVTDKVYTVDDLPTPIANIDIIVLTKGQVQWEPSLDHDGNQKYERDNPENPPLHRKTGVRGVRVTIANAGLTYTTEIRNKPTLWKEFEEIVFVSGYQYTFLDEGTIQLGLKVI